MYTNGETYRISTRNGVQRKNWADLFQMETLPVVSPWPHEGVNAHGRSRWFYTLDPKRMTVNQIHVLASHIAARQQGAGYLNTLDRIRNEGWSIDAMDCFLEDENETAEAKQESLPSFSLRRVLSGLVTVA